MDRTYQHIFTPPVGIGKQKNLRILVCMESLYHFLQGT